MDIACCVGYVALNSKFHVIMAYVNYYYNAIGAMIYHILYLHKTHVSYNKKQDQYGKMSKKKKLNYVMLYYTMCI